MSPFERPPEDDFHTDRPLVVDLDGEEFEPLPADCTPEDRIGLADLQWIDALLTYACTETEAATERRICRAFEAIGGSPAGQPEVPRQPLLFGGVFHGATGFLSSHELFTGYMVATVFFAVAAIVSSHIYLPRHQGPKVEYVKNHSISPTPMPVKHDYGPEIVSVGRITGMVDCRWGNENEAPFHNKIKLHDKFALKSGLMEITYHTGAKVILQGPCSYEVESADGGYLSLGKLTARVESRSRLPDEPSRSRLPSGTLPTDHDTTKSRPAESRPAGGTYFAVRTPTAVVTDLGTEFGVEAKQDGLCEVHVLEGVVEARFNKPGSSEAIGKLVRISSGNAWRYDPADNQPTSIAFHRDTYAKIRILRPDDRRKRWLEYSRKLRKDPSLVAYFAFEQENAGKSTLTNASTGGATLDARIFGAKWQAGRFPGKPSLWFRGTTYDDRVELPDESRFDFTGSFSVAVWFRTDDVLRFPMWTALISKSDTAWTLHRNTGKNCLYFDTRLPGDTIYRIADTRAISRRMVFDGRWHLAVAVFESDGRTGRKRLYIDGQLDAEVKSPPLLQMNNEPVMLGNCTSRFDKESSMRAFSGWIDEAAIFSRAITWEEIREMFFAGDPVCAMVK